jgi:hypothetical protein
MLVLIVHPGLVCSDWAQGILDMIVQERGKQNEQEAEAQWAVQG